MIRIRNMMYALFVVLVWCTFLIKLFSAELPCVITVKPVKKVSWIYEDTGVIFIQRNSIEFPDEVECMNVPPVYVPLGFRCIFFNIEEMEGEAGQLSEMVYNIGYAGKGDGNKILKEILDGLHVNGWEIATKPKFEFKRICREFIAKVKEIGSKKKPTITLDILNFKDKNCTEWVYVNWEIHLLQGYF